MLNDTGHSRDDEQDVPDHSDQDSPDNGGVTAEVCICDVGSEEGDNVAPWRERERRFDEDQNSPLEKGDGTYRTGRK